MELTKKYLINGPNNIIRLTDGNKILYIFGDFHLRTENQNECSINDKYDSIDIDKFLFKFMKLEKNKEFDMFIESYNLDPSFNTDYKEKYINNVNRLFNSRIEYKDNKIFTLTPYSNFRFHHFDIRNLLYKFNEIINYCYNEFSFPYSYLNLENIYYKQIEISKLLAEILNYFKHSEDKVITKLKTKYNNKNIKDKIEIIYNDIVINNILRTVKINNKFIKLLEKTLKDNNNLIIDKSYMKILSNIYIKLQKIKDNIFYAYLVVTDLNFIRRFLDKDYIKNTIIYTGLSHFSDIGYILHKYFDFKITNIYHINEEIKIEEKDFDKEKDFKYLKKLDNFFTNMNNHQVPIQCSNLFNFPVNFT
jgi:hypothetical protein